MSKLIEAAKRKVSTFCARWARAEFDSAIEVAAELDGIFEQLAEAVEGWEAIKAMRETKEKSDA